MFGSVTVRKARSPEAPSVSAASSSARPCSCMIGISSRATKGKVTNIVASTMPGTAKTTCTPLRDHPGAERGVRAEQQHEAEAGDDRRDRERQVDQRDQEGLAGEVELRDRPGGGDAEDRVERHRDRRRQQREPDRRLGVAVAERRGGEAEPVGERLGEDRDQRREEQHAEDRDDAADQRPPQPGGLGRGDLRAGGRPPAGCSSAAMALIARRAAPRRIRRRVRRRAGRQAAEPPRRPAPGCGDGRRRADQRKPAAERVGREGGGGRRRRAPRRPPPRPRRGRRAGAPARRPPCKRREAPGGAARRGAVRGPAGSRAGTLQRPLTNGLISFMFFCAVNPLATWSK